MVPASAQKKKRGSAPLPAPVADTVRTPAAASPKAEDPLETQRRVFTLAVRYSDGVVAKQALYEMIARYPENTNLLDSLALIYFDLGEYAACVLVSRDIVKFKPNDLNILLVKGMSEKNIGLLNEALLTYEKLYMQTENVFHLYEVAFMQYQLKKPKPCEVSVELLLAHEDIDKETIPLAGPNNTQEEVPLRAAVLNLQGILASDQGDKDQARKSFRKALELAPNFSLAKSNLADLDKKK